MSDDFDLWRSVGISVEYGLQFQYAVIRRTIIYEDILDILVGLFEERYSTLFDILLNAVDRD